MSDVKGRIFGAIIILIFGGLTYYNWHQLNTEGSYSMKLAAFGPVGIVGGVFVLLFAARVGKPQTTADKVLVLLIFGLGLAAGLCNWYLTDPGFFGR